MEADRHSSVLFGKSLCVALSDRFLTYTHTHPRPCLLLWGELKGRAVKGTKEKGQIVIALICVCLSWAGRFAQPIKVRFPHTKMIVASISSPVCFLICFKELGWINSTISLSDLWIKVGYYNWGLCLAPFQDTESGEVSMGGRGAVPAVTGWVALLPQLCSHIQGWERSLGWRLWALCAAFMMGFSGEQRMKNDTPPRPSPPSASPSAGIHPNLDTLRMKTAGSTSLARLLTALTLFSCVFW